MSRCFALAVLGLTLSLPAIIDAARAADPNSPGGPTLKVTLEKGLKARRPVEFAFIANVAARVEAGTLDRKLVNTTFLWARKKQPFPFPYFQQALIQRAKQAGVTL